MKEGPLGDKAPAEGVRSNSQPSHQQKVRLCIVTKRGRTIDRSP